MLPFLLLALALPACGAVRPVQESLLLPASFGQPPQEALSVSACYRTLAKVDCYLEPQPAYRERRVGWFDAPSPH